MIPNRFRQSGCFSRSAIALAAILPLLSACGGSDDKADGGQVALDAATQTASVDTLYNNGMDALNAQRYTSAINQFAAVEANYPYSSWAQRALLMEGYAQYMANHYTDSIGTLNRFTQLYPTSTDIPYAYYLRALCYYEQIEDIQRDQQDTVDAMNALQVVVDRFPGSAYARDAQLKIDLCRDHLAGKEMAIGRWYQGQHFYEAAIGRFQTVVNDFQTTNHVPEALARLVEVYLALGLSDEARKTAAVLGYNYPGNYWYAVTYDQLQSDHLVNGVPPPHAGGPGFFSRTWNWLF
ncbi:MAG TPA: outer membrane protein assembly factor BamD [Acetobacteraceae bacterium]|jgi:outer membrane protein assembly factor BamD|nr:outer membrane protein assembly factor BamD [Acetobacteraceae bacterium]